MAVEFVDDCDVKTKRKYVLKCWIRKYRGQAQQGLQGGLSEYDAVLLIPEINDQSGKFFDAWLPDPLESNTVEIVASMPHPVNSGCRLSVHRMDERCPARHYLFVMSKGVEDILKHLDGQKIMITVRPETEDEVADSAIEPDSSFDVVD
jgi:hypothetical protein